MTPSIYRAYFFDSSTKDQLAPPLCPAPFCSEAPTHGCNSFPQPKSQSKEPPCVKLRMLFFTDASLHIFPLGYNLPWYSLFCIVTLHSSFPPLFELSFQTSGFSLPRLFVPQLLTLLTRYGPCLKKAKLPSGRLDWLLLGCSLPLCAIFIRVAPLPMPEFLGVVLDFFARAHSGRCLAVSLFAEPFCPDPLTAYTPLGSFDSFLTRIGLAFRCDSSGPGPGLFLSSDSFGRRSAVPNLLS